MEPLIDRKTRSNKKTKGKRSDLDHTMARKAAAQARLARQMRSVDEDENDIRLYMR